MATMNRKTMWAILIIIIIGLVAFWYTKNAAPVASPDTQLTSLGSYEYECDEHVGFVMTPAGDMNSIAIAATSSGAYPPASTLVKKDSATGVRYEGNGIIFTARGETVTLGERDSAINCSPVRNPDEAPFNFGD